jgi:NTE family protein
VRKLRARGTEVLVLQPSAEDLGVMGTNLMARNRRAEVTEQAYRSVARALLDDRSMLADLRSAASSRPTRLRRAA